MLGIQYYYNGFCFLDSEGKPSPLCELMVSPSDFIRLYPQIINSDMGTYYKVTALLMMRRRIHTLTGNYVRLNLTAYASTHTKKSGRVVRGHIKDEYDFVWCEGEEVSIPDNYRTEDFGKLLLWNKFFRKEVSYTEFSLTHFNIVIELSSRPKPDNLFV